MRGLFCANFASSRSGWPACNSVWCGPCYGPLGINLFPRSLPQDEGGFVWARDEDLQRHLHARDGDHLLTPFQCDLCVFRNLKGRNPGAHDTFLLATIRQVNLDALWGRESATVAATLRGVRQTVTALRQVQLPPPFPPLGPHPMGDSMGYSTAIAMLVKSWEPGRYVDHQQFETIRKLRSCFSNVYMASAQGVASLRTVGGERAKHYLNDCPTHSLWFERFSRGCLSRMGQIVCQDRAISLELMHALVELLESEWRRASDTKDSRGQDVVASVAAYCLIAFCGSFRGSEVFQVDLHGLIKYAQEDLAVDGRPYVIIPLLGRFKNELGDQYHLTPLAATTKSGLEVKKWVDRLVEVRKAARFEQGPTFAGPRMVMTYASYEREILDRLQVVQYKKPHIIPGDVMVLEEYGISRSFRRGATSEARARGTSAADVDLVNRWRTFENAKGKRPRMAMRDHYADIRLMIPALIRFSENL